MKSGPAFFLPARQREAVEAARSLVTATWGAGVPVPPRRNVPAPSKSGYIPLFVANAEAFANHPRALDIIEHLHDRSLDPHWSRDRACFGCENWQPKHGYGQMPMRPGRGVAAVESCSGCWYSMMDVDPDRRHDVDNAIKLRLAWMSVLQIAKKQRVQRYTRALRYDTVDKQGFAGKKDERQRSGFAVRHKLPERTPCPKCQAPAKIERYHLTRAGKEETVAMLAIRCSCGTTHTAEAEI